jgi:hypothetical protein
MRSTLNDTMVEGGEPQPRLSSALRAFFIERPSAGRDAVGRVGGKVTGPIAGQIA